MRLIFAAIIAVSTPLISQVAELALTRVVLSTSGLAQFTYSGEIVGKTVIEVPVRLDQANDVLKSLTIFDSAGSIGAVSLPGKILLTSCLAIFPLSVVRLAHNRRY